MSDTITAAAPTTVKSFADFGVDPTICASLTEIGITSPFPIQELTLPLALSGADIIGQARTGTGKTLGFGLPLLQRIKLDGGLQVLIVVPTRELCMQVAEDLAQAGKGKGVKVVALYGGKAMQPQIDGLEGGAHLVVGTPGRLLDLSRRGFLRLGGVNGLVLDEADEMLDLGFLPDVEQLIEMCADKRQTLLFSATMPAAIVSLARRYMTKPTFMRADIEEITIGPQTKQYFFSCHRMDKPAVLARILQAPDRGLCLVFCRTKRMADILSEELRDRDIPAQAIHSDLRQEARERALQKFRDGKTTVLCATEVAARGLDIDHVSHVVNYDCPDDEKMYLHRIGRTGRAGADGVAITFATYNEIPRLEMIRRELGIEEEILEVFSTSPLLEQLFDLPARETRAKVPSTPQARTAKPSKSRRPERDDERGDRAEPSKATATKGRDRVGEATLERAERTPRRGAVHRGEAAAEDDPRRRRRQRGGSDDADATATSPGTLVSEPVSGRTKSDAGTTDPAQGVTEDHAARRPAAADAEGGSGTIITRRRRRRGGRGAQDEATATQDHTPAARFDDPDLEGSDLDDPDLEGSDHDDPDLEGSDHGGSGHEGSAVEGSHLEGTHVEGSDGGRGESSTRTRTRSARASRSERTERSDAAEPAARGDATGPLQPSELGHRPKTDVRGDREGRGEPSGRSNRGEPTERGERGERSGRQQSPGAQRGGERNGGDSSSGRGNKGRGGKARGGDDRSRSGGGERTGKDRADRAGGDRAGYGRSERGGNGGGRDRLRRSTVDPSEARGDGQPRLSRKMEVQHLP